MDIIMLAVRANMWHSFPLFVISIAGCNALSNKRRVSLLTVTKVFFQVFHAISSTIEFS